MRYATLGAGGGASWGLGALALLDQYVIGPGVTGDVPVVVQWAVLAAATAITAWAAGRKARHTARPDLPISQR